MFDPAAKTLRMVWPAIIEFDGILYQQQYDVDQNVNLFVEISAVDAKRWGVDVSKEQDEPGERSADSPVFLREIEVGND